MKKKFQGLVIIAVILFSSVFLSSAQQLFALRSFGNEENDSTIITTIQEKVWQERILNEKMYRDNRDELHNKDGTFLLPESGTPSDFFVMFNDNESLREFLSKGFNVEFTFGQLNSIIIPSIEAPTLIRMLEPFAVKYLSPFENALLKINVEEGIKSIDNGCCKNVDERTGRSFTPKTQTSAQVINATTLWSGGYKGSGVKIAILDTGININHSDFQGRIVSSKSFVLNEYGYSSEELTIEDNQGHGSHVAGIAAGDGTGNSAYIGIAPEANLIIAKIAGTEGIATYAGLIAAFNWAVAQDADVINLSFGGEDFPATSPISVLLKTIVEEGRLITMSAGNEGTTIGIYSISTPGSEDAVITVGACDNSGIIASFSSIGPTVHQHRKPDIVAPGVQIMAPSSSGSNYVSRGGTSMAAPHVAGAVALLIQMARDEGLNYNPGAIKAALLATANPTGGGDPNRSGRGLLNVGNARNLLINAPRRIDNTPMALVVNPINFPNDYYTILPAGQIYNEYLTLVTSIPDQTTIEVTSSLRDYMNFTASFDSYTTNVPITITIPKDITEEEITGIMTFKVSSEFEFEISIEIDVPTNSGVIGLDLFHSISPINHFLGRYKEFIRMAMTKGVAINPITEEITADLLEELDCLWMPDPCNTEYPNILNDNETAQILRPISDSEEAAIVNFVSNGGALFICLRGKTIREIYEEMRLCETVPTEVTKLTENWGISVSDSYRNFASGVTTLAVYNNTHPATEGISFVSYYGSHLSVSSGPTVLVKYGSNPIIVASEGANDGRVLVSATTAFIENEGYTGEYGALAQNEELCETILGWFIPNYSIKESHTIAYDQSKIDFTVEVTNVGRPVAPPYSPIGMVIRDYLGEITNTTLSMTYIGFGRYTTTYSFPSDGNYTFIFEIEDSIAQFNYLRDATPPEITIPHEITINETTEIVFFVTDPFCESPNVTATIDGEQIAVTKINQTSFKLLVNYTQFSSSPGEHELIIEAIDDKGNLGVETVVLDFSGQTPTTSPPTSSVSTKTGATSLVLIAEITILFVIASVLIRRKKDSM